MRNYLLEQRKLTDYYNLEEKLPYTSLTQLCINTGEEQGSSRLVLPFGAFPLLCEIMVMHTVL